MENSDKLLPQTYIVRQLGERKREGKVRKEKGVLSPAAFLSCMYNVSFLSNGRIYIHTASEICLHLLRYHLCWRLLLKLIICCFLFVLCMPKGWVRAVQSGSPRLVLIRGWEMEQRAWNGSNWIPWCLTFSVVKNPRPGSVVYCSRLSPYPWSYRKHSFLLKISTLYLRWELKLITMILFGAK